MTRQLELWPRARASSTLRVRVHRARERAARARAWRELIGVDLEPVLSAWAAIGLRLPPSERQAELLRAHAPTMAHRLEAGALLRRLPRARASATHSAVYNLVRSLLDGLAVLMAGRTPATPSGRATEGQEDPGRAASGAPMARTPEQRGSGPPGELLERLRRAGLSRELLDAWRSKLAELADDAGDSCSHGLQA